MNPFQSLRDYEEFVYTLQPTYPAIQGSTLVVIRRGERVLRPTSNIIAFLRQK